MKEEQQKEIELLEYKSHGFPMFFITYDYTFKYWSCCFRNPAEFKNPDIKEDSPQKAVEKMLQFMRTQQ